MFRLVGAGPTAIEPLPGGSPGDRLVRVQTAPGVVVELVFGPEFIEQYVVPRLTMGDGELVALLEKELEKEREEVDRESANHQTRKKLHLPG